MRTIKWIVLTFMLVYGAFTVWEVIKVVEFRDLPRPRQGKRLISGDWPHNIVAKYVVFRRGTLLYDNLIRSCVYKAEYAWGRQQHCTASDVLDVLSGEGEACKYSARRTDLAGVAWAEESVMRDLPWNRWLLESDLLRMNNETLDYYLPRYPLTPTERIESRIVGSLERGEFRVIPLLGLVGNGERLQRWFRRKMTSDQGAVFEALPYLTTTESFPLVDILDELWQQMDAQGKEFLVAVVALNVKPDSRHVEKILPWALEKFDANSGELSEMSVYLLSRLITMPTTHERVTQYVAARSETHGNSLIRRILNELPKSSRRAMADPFFETLRESDPQLALDILSSVASRNTEAGEALAKPVIDGPDSRLRKAVIVTLVNNGSEKGYELIDEAFTGAAPRTVLFRNVRDLWGSKAMDEYERIARHGYLETDKTFPPSCVDGPPWPDEAERWRGFIARYPWFPGTDDAYYRLAYRLMATGDTLAALAAIDKFFGRDFIDDDAAYCLTYLLAVMSFKSEEVRSRSSMARNLYYLYNSPPLGQVYLQSNVNTSLLVSTLDWFLQDERRMRYIESRKEDLERLRWLAVNAETEPVGLRCLRAWVYMDKHWIPPATFLYWSPPKPAFYSPEDDLLREYTYLPRRIVLEKLAREAPTRSTYLARNDSLAGIATWALIHSRMWVEDEYDHKLRESLKAKVRRWANDDLPEELKRSHFRLKAYGQ